MFRTFAILIVSFLVGANAWAARNAQTYLDTRKLLSSLTSVKDNREVLATLFKSGDGRITDLIEALNDRDRKISLQAQVVIRYLGNETGMKALETWYTNQAEVISSGPIPLPLSERDYKFIKVHYVDRPSITWVSADKYIYALAIDGSPKAKALLIEMMKRAGTVDDSTVGGHALGRVLASNPERLLRGQADLAKMVSKNAFFISQTDRMYTSATLLGLNSAKTKALVEVFIDRGHLAEEWYHVVISKHGRNWKFFSITQVAVS